LSDFRRCFYTKSRDIILGGASIIPGAEVRTAAMLFLLMSQTQVNPGSGAPTESEVSQLVTKCLVFYGTRNFITEFKGMSSWSLF